MTSSGSGQTGPAAEIWAILREISETQRETAREVRDLRKSQQRTDEHLRRTERMFLGNWGKLVESLVEGDLVRLLREREMDVTRVTQRLELHDDPRRREIDLLAWNGEEMVQWRSRRR